MTDEPRGELLDAVLTAALREDELLSPELLRTAAAHLAQTASRYANPVLCPLGTGGNRLLGAATVLATSPLSPRGWNIDVAGRTVLIVGTVGVGPLAVHREIDLMRQRGAHTVIVCALDNRLDSGDADDFVLLSATPTYDRVQHARSA